MSIKRKLILIGICVVIVLSVFVVNVIKRMNSGKEGEPLESVVKENVITRAEAYRLLSYLDYNKTERESLTFGITYETEQMSDWYDSFVNAAWKMGLIEGTITVTPKTSMTYGYCKELIDKLIIKNLKFQEVYEGLSFDFTNANEEMLTIDFLEVYEAILTTLPEENNTIREETLLVLGNEVTENGKDRMVTDLGKYYYQNAKSYEAIYKIKQQEKENIQTEGNDSNTEEEEAKGESIEASETIMVNQYLDKGIKVLLCDQEIIYITDVTTESIIVHNVWIEKGEGSQVDAFVNGLHKSFNAKSKLSTSIEKVIGDITVENQKVIQISVKPDMIQGKVLRSGKDFIEIEGYGNVPLEEDYKIYKIYDELSMEPTGSILVGYENTDFIVSEGKISAALITESIKAENIRVLIRTTNFGDIFHEKVEFTATSDFVVSNKDAETAYKAGDIVIVEPKSELLEKGRITVETTKEDAKIELLSLERSEGAPKYRGRIEIAEGDNGLIIINELPLEEYLYSVIPSEMPTYYGMEALKVQAVCARTYAYKHLLANSLSAYGAHVDDSVAYQVYNNIEENEDTILAVKDTYGKVIEFDGEVITAYYFSTSCGHTAQAANVWANDSNFPYLEGKLLFVEKEGEGSEAQSELADQYADLSSEENFRSFIDDEKLITYDSSFNWYRWKVTMNKKDIKKVIDETLANRYNANPELILTMTSEAKGSEEAVFESIPVDTIGNLVDISVLKRESSGIISEILITGTKNTIKVKTEYNIRTLLAPTYDKMIRQDDSEVENLKLLPSAFFAIDKKEKDDVLSSITLTGGGYGHGVGMSQNGVKALADEGQGYEAIVSYFYEGTEIGFIYE